MKQFLVTIVALFSVLYSNSGIISGFVSDSSSGEALIGANVFLKETGQGMATDMNGYYIIQNIEHFLGSSELFHLMMSRGPFIYSASIFFDLLGHLWTHLNTFGTYFVTVWTFLDTFGHF